MKQKLLFSVLALLCTVMLPAQLKATKYITTKVIDKEYLVIQFRDGEVRYRDDATGPSAYLGHSFAEGDDTLKVFGQRLDAKIAAEAAKWTISSGDDKTFGSIQPLAVYRKSKPMNTDHTLTSENDHWLFLKLPKAMKQGYTYTVSIPEGMGSDAKQGEVKFDIYNSMSEAVHVNIIGYQSAQPVKAADLYLWLGDGGQRDYSTYVGKKYIFIM